jgi:hypothetical protein
MWEAMKSLFQRNNDNCKMVLREKLRDTKMIGLDTLTSYLIRIRKVRDELAVVGKTMVDLDLVSMGLKGFTKE